MRNTCLKQRSTTQRVAWSPGTSRPAIAEDFNPPCRQAEKGFRFHHRRSSNAAIELDDGISGQLVTFEIRPGLQYHPPANRAPARTNDKTVRFGSIDIRNYRPATGDSLAACYRSIVFIFKQKHNPWTVFDNARVLRFSIIRKSL